MTSTLAHATSTVGVDLLRRMADALSVPDGGFSVDPRTGGAVTSGYAVAVFPEREQQISDRVLVADVSAYVFRHASVLAGSGVVVGGWRDPESGIAFLDVSRVVADRETAVRLARQHRQLAYFDFAAGQSVPVAP